MGSFLPAGSGHAVADHVRPIQLIALARREALALDDILRDAPGVYAQRKWGGDVRISIRGI